MSEWGVSIYGEPCRGCGFSWSVTVGDAIVLVADVPGTYARTLVGATGTERHPDLSWSVSSYVSHVADNLRIWAERLAGVAAGASLEVGGYDEDELARARGYDQIPLQAAMWSLARSVAGWQYAVRQTQRTGVVLDPPRAGCSVAVRRRADQRGRHVPPPLGHREVARFGTRRARTQKTVTTPTRFCTDRPTCVVDMLQGVSEETPCDNRLLIEITGVPVKRRMGPGSG